jgi:hypothetical protein
MVCDYTNSKFRKIMLSDLNVSTFVGVGSSIVAVTIWSPLTDYILTSVEGGGGQVFRYSYPSGVKTLFAGSGTSAAVDDVIGTSASFRNPQSMSIWKCNLPGYGAYSSPNVCRQCPTGTESNGKGVCLVCTPGTCGACKSVSPSASTPVWDCSSGTVSRLNYPVNDNLYGIIAPTSALSVTLNFTAFNTELNNDALVIYSYQCAS